MATFINRILAPLTCTLMIVTASLVLNGCSSSVVINSDFPEPLTPTLPVTLGIYYPDDFKHYVYTENSEDRSKWTIDSGAAHTKVLNKVFGKMFQHIEQLEQPNSTAVDLIFEPHITDFQYAVPRETKVNIYEVWIKYNFKVYDSQGELVADWITSAYGKTPTAFLKSNEEAMHEAVVIALRDLGANIVLSFQQVPEIKAWLAQAGRPS